MLQTSTTAEYAWLSRYMSNVTSFIDISINSCRKLSQFISMPRIEIIYSSLASSKSLLIPLVNAYLLAWMWEMFYFIYQYPYSEFRLSLRKDWSYDPAR